MAALQSHSSFRGQSGTDGGGEPREDLGWGKLNRSHGERSVGREQAHAHESKGGEPRERPMPGVHATRRGTRLTLRYLAFPCPSLARIVLPPLPLSRTLLFFSSPLPFLLLLPLLFTFSTTFTFLCQCTVVAAFSRFWDSIGKLEVYRSHVCIVDSQEFTTCVKRLNRFQDKTRIRSEGITGQRKVFEQ